MKDFEEDDDEQDPTYRVQEIPEQTLEEEHPEAKKPQAVVKSVTKATHDLEGDVITPSSLFCIE